jgi:type IV pilus assembly protein PilP
MRARLIAVIVAGTCLGLGACGEEQVTGASGRAAGARRTAQQDAGVADAASPGSLPKPDFQEQDWAESERSRDPFRSFATVFVEEARGRVKSQREVVLDTYSLEQLKLVGIVLRSNPPVAMLVDPTGKGHTIRRGQFVGRPEVVQVGQRGAAYEINWRVDRIRDGDVVFVREDPQNPDVPSATKVLALRPEEEHAYSP